MTLSAMAYNGKNHHFVMVKIIIYLPHLY